MYGGKLKKGDVISLFDGARFSSTEPVRKRPQELIYLISHVASHKPNEPVRYHLDSILAADQERTVLDTLKRRDSFPVTTVTEPDGRKIGIREITFRGTIDQAVELLGSSSQAAVLLGRRRLLKSGSVGLKAVAKMIESKMMQPAGLSIGELQGLKNGVQFLGSAKGGDAQLNSLLKKMIAGIKNGDPPPKIKQNRIWQIEEHERSDVNHSMLWILKAMAKTKASKESLTDLIKLRGDNKSKWKNEIEFALKESRVLDTIQLNAAFKNGKSFQVFDLKAGSGIKGHSVFFAPDGERLIVNGDIYRVSDDSKLGSSPYLKGTKLVASRDKKRIFIFGYQRKKNRNRRLALWQIGRHFSWTSTTDFRWICVR